MEIENYRQIKSDKIQYYHSKGYTDEQIDFPLQEILCTLDSIAGVYKYLTPPEQWHNLADFMKRHALLLPEAVIEKDLCDKEYLYQKIRAYIHKQSFIIRALRYSSIPIPNDQEEYQTIVAEMAVSYLDLCVENLKSDAEDEIRKINLAKANLVPEKHAQKCASKPMATRIKDVKQANERWQKILSESNDSDSDSNTKKRKSNAENISSNLPTKKSKHVFWTDNVNKTAGSDELQAPNPCSATTFTQTHTNS